MFQCALIVNCCDLSARRLCKKFGVSETQLIVIERLEEFDARYDSAQYDFIGVDRELLLRPAPETWEVFQKLSNCTQSLIVVGSSQEGSTDASGLVNVSMQRVRNIVPMIEHESRNVLQGIQMRIELVRSEAAQGRPLVQNLDRLDVEVRRMQDLFLTMRLANPAVELEREFCSIRELIESCWRQINNEDPTVFDVTFELGTYQDLFIDIARLRHGVRSILKFLRTVTRSGGTIQVVDRLVEIDGVAHVKIIFLATISNGRRTLRVPSAELTIFQQTVEQHGGCFELDTSDHSKASCTIGLPFPVSPKHQSTVSGEVIGATDLLPENSNSYRVD